MTPSSAPHLVVVLSTASPESPEAAMLALRYAATAAAMDVVVEMHAVSAGALRLFVRGVASAELMTQVRQASELGVSLFVCSAALASSGLAAEALIDEVSGARGAASLLAAGFAPQARLLNF